MENEHLVAEFLRESNAIEAEYSDLAFKDATKAWEYAWEDRNDMNVSHVLDTHKILMCNINPQVAGRFRVCDVWVGCDRRRFVSEDCFRHGVQDILEQMCPNYKAKSIPEVHVRDVHVRFEKLHPFEDGNGRVGRILYNIHRTNIGLPIHVICSGDDQLDYYRWFD